MYKFIKILLVVFCVNILSFSNVLAQEFLRTKDLSKVKVDLLTDADLSKIKQQLVQQNISLDQARPLLISRGMSLTEFSKLKAKLQSTSKRVSNNRS